MHRTVNGTRLGDSLGQALGQAGTHAEPQSRGEISGRHLGPISAPLRLCVRYFEKTFFPASKYTEGSVSDLFTVSDLKQSTF